MRRRYTSIFSQSFRAQIGKKYTNRAAVLPGLESPNKYPFKPSTDPLQIGSTGFKIYCNLASLGIRINFPFQLSTKFLSFALLFLFLSIPLLLLSHCMPRNVFFDGGPIKWRLLKSSRLCLSVKCWSQCRYLVNPMPLFF